MQRFLFLIPFLILPLSFVFSQCYTDFVVTNVADLDCSAPVTLNIDYAPTSGGGNSCFQVDYFDGAGNAQQKQYTNQTGPGSMVITDVDCAKTIAFTPYSSPNCNGSSCATIIAFESVGELINSNTLALAVELTHFSAEIIDDKSTLLSWRTGSEVDNHRFEIEKSEDGLIWNKIGRVAGAGTSSEVLDYNFEDRSELKSITYYRIADVDYAGIRTYSEMISVESRTKRGHINSFPNPITNRLLIPDVIRGDIVTMTALDGRTISRVIITTDMDSYELDMVEQPQGIYLLTFQRADIILTSKVIKR